MPTASADYQFLNLANALEYLVDRQGVRDMLPHLMKSLDRDVPDITQMLLAGNSAEAALRLHSLKGFLPIFCYPDLFSELVRVEKLCKAGPSADLQEAYGALALQLQGLARDVSHFQSESD